MFKKKVGFLGCGNIAQAIINGLINSKYIHPTNLLVYDHKININQEISQKYGLKTINNVENLLSEIDVLFIAIKPNIFLKVLKNLVDYIKKDTMIISVAAGITLNALSEVLGNNRKIIRVMPNISSLVNEGMTSITPNSFIKNEELFEIIELLKSFSKIEIVTENLIHSVISVSSSSMAYVFMLIEAMADGAVLGGMPRAQAYQFAAQAVKGAAHMVLKTGKHPGELKDMVCSPGGTTIEAVKELEERGFRSSVIKAVQQCMLKSKRLSGE
ncbi:pyrroline-5-carboxylate reductase [Pantoea sp. Aalb]|uniref:pyrroline-5-carboxylate reductase n=1 Tax=Pantoea sp. Aalb TaxID=2576762 RepID=UPI001328D431|nr:pyrroline-5-carboxylate reductase [Pantoea sp. Aalb]MXP67595.1 pyrroline-5-carboxylate reductase [Pantoea sp. Aalb]